ALLAERLAAVEDAAPERHRAAAGLAELLVGAELAAARLIVAAVGPETDRVGAGHGWAGGRAGGGGACLVVRGAAGGASAARSVAAPTARWAWSAGTGSSPRGWPTSCRTCSRSSPPRWERRACASPRSSTPSATSGSS